MSSSAQRKLLAAYIFLLACVGWLAMRYDRYAVDGDAVSYMDIADLLHAHHWAGAVNAYWHPLYPALLWGAQAAFHSTRSTELGAYYVLNYVLLLVQIAAMFLFTRAVLLLRAREGSDEGFLLTLPVLQLLGMTLLTIPLMRELSLGKVRTDSLLQALFLFAFAMLLRSLAAESAGRSIAFAAGMGLCFGLAYLTKSFAFVLALLSIAILVVSLRVLRAMRWPTALLCGVVAAVTFAAFAGPYVAALSLQKHRFDFGDSGSLNYAWYVSGTEKMHLEPWMKSSFGSATVHLLHPEVQLLATPDVYSYKPFPYGTYPPWFDATYFNERITPKFSLRRLIPPVSRNLVLIARYLFNHPEPLLLLAILLGTRLGTLHWRKRTFWPVVGLGAAIWALYATVNVEERYVTVAYLAMLVAVYAAVRVSKQRQEASVALCQNTATLLVVLLSLLTLGELLRQSLVNRRDELVSGQTVAWRSSPVFSAAEALNRLGVQAGGEVACIGGNACLNDLYWARLAGVRILTEVYEPRQDHLAEQLDAMPQRESVYQLLRAQGAQALVGVFDPGSMNSAHPGAAGWVRLGETNYYALPLRAQ